MQEHIILHENSYEGIVVAEKMTIARPYAKAVFEYATASKTVVDWSGALYNLAEVAKNKQVLALLLEDAISTQDTVEIFLSVCKNHLEKPLKNLILLLTERKRLKILPEIYLQYKMMLLDSENRIEVDFRSSVSLDEGEKKAYKKALEKYLSKTVTLRCEVDAHLLGGFLASAGNIVIDGSIRGSLSNLKTAMGD